MICKRCGSECPERKEGYCFHCLVGLETGLIDKKTQQPVKGVREGFPHYQIPKKEAGVER